MFDDENGILSDYVNEIYVCNVLIILLSTITNKGRRQGGPNEKISLYYLIYLFKILLLMLIINTC